MTCTADQRLVREAQKALSAAGHPAHPSGHFDRATYRAVCAFQNARSLPVSGKVDEATWKALAGAPVVAEFDEPTPAPVVEEAEAVLPAEAPTVEDEPKATKKTRRRSTK